MTKRLVLIGGVLGIILLMACGGHPPPLKTTPDPSQIYSGYKGDSSRNGYSNTDDSIEFVPLWQIKFRRPLFYQPCLAGDFIFQPSADKKIHVVDVNTGEEVAEIKVRRHIGTTPEISGPYMAVCEEGINSELVVFNYIEGRVVWSAKTNKACLQPVLSNNKIFWVDGRNRLNAAWLKDGKSIWTERIKGGSDVGPIMGDGKLYLSARDSTIYCLNPVDGAIIWKTPGMGRTNSSPAYFGNELYICNSDGVVTCYNADSGDLRWHYDDGSRLFYSPSVDETSAYFGSGSGRFIKLDRLTGEKIWEFQAESPVRGTAIVNAKAVIFASLDYTVYVLDKTTGRPITSYVAGGMISAAPVLFDRKLLIAAQDKYLSCFSLEGEE